MAVEPVSFRINLMISEADQAIKEANDRLAPFRAKNKPVPIKYLSQYYRLLQHRHGLELQRIFPQAVILADVHFTIGMDADGEPVALRVKSGQGRIADFAIVYGDQVWLIEAKVLNEVLKAFPKRARTKPVIDKIVPSSKAGIEFANELRILKRYAKKAVLLGLKGYPVLGGPREEVFPEVEMIEPFRLQAYRMVGGPQIPNKPATRKMGGTAKPLAAIDIVAGHPAPSAKALVLQPPPPLPPRVSPPPSAATSAKRSPVKFGTSAGAKAQEPILEPVRTAPGGVLQPPISARGVGADRAGSRGNLRWPASGVQGKLQAGRTVMQRARGATGGVAAAIEQVSEGFTKFSKSFPTERALKAAENPEIFKQIQNLRHAGNWVRMVAVYWTDQDTLEESNSVFFRFIDIYSLADPEGRYDEKSARENLSWKSRSTMTQRSGPGESDSKPDYFRIVGVEMNFYAPEPEFEYFDEDISTDRFKMGRCIRRRIR